MERLTTAAGHSVAYRVAGDGDATVVAVHGSPGDSGNWRRLAPLIAAQARFVGVDLLRHGASEAPEDRVTVDHQAAAVEAVVGRDRGADVVIAHSYGGVVALRAALRGAVRIGHLLLLEPVAVPLLGLTDIAAYQQAHRVLIEQYARAAEEGETDAGRRMIDLWFGAGAYETMGEAFQRLLRDRLMVNVRDVQATFDETYRIEELANLPVPVTVVVGEQSPPLAGRIAESLASLAPRVEVQRLPDATHAMPTTHPEELAALVRAHL